MTSTIYVMLLTDVIFNKIPFAFEVGLVIQYLEVGLLEPWLLGQHLDQCLARHLGPVHLLHGLEVGDGAGRVSNNKRALSHTNTSIVSFHLTVQTEKLAKIKNEIGSDNPKQCVFPPS